MKLDNLINNLLILSTSFLCITILNPYMMWRYGRLFHVGFLLISILCFYLSRFRSKCDFLKKKENYIIIISIFCFYRLYGASWLGSLAFSASAVLLFNLKPEEISKCFKVFIYLYVILLIPGLVLWLVHELTGNNQLFKIGSVPLDLIPSRYKVLRGEGYSVYPGAVVLDYMEKDNVYRFMGPFDEPGVVGTTAALILSVYNYNLKKITNCLILFAGLVSFSLAFYFMAIFYLGSVVLLNFKENLSKLVILIFIILFSIAGEYLGVKTLSRVGLTFNFTTWTSGKAIKIVGDSRESIDFKKEFINWKNSDSLSLLFGLKGEGYGGASSWRQIPVKAGLVGTVIFISILISLIVKSYGVATRELIVFLATFVSSIYQRPDVLNMTFLMLLTCGVMFLSKKKFSNLDSCHI